MSFDRCLFAVALPPGGAPAGVVRGRAERLARFYAPLGPVDSALRVLPEAGVVVGAARVHGRQDAIAPLEVWGEPAPEGLRSCDAVLAASDRQLRALEGVSALVAARGDRCRIVGSSGGPATLYAARAPDGTAAWATHAVAAGWLARGEIELDAGALGEHVAFDLVGGERTFVRGVTAPAAATVVDLGPGGVAERCYWPPAERWAASAEEPVEEASAALLGSLGRRLARTGRPLLALTAGADSRVLALALRELGMRVDAFTWGDPEWPDVAGARAVAEAMGASHRVLPARFLDPGEALRELDARARWSDGVTALPLAAQPFPGDADAWVTGMGGETGRAFYWRARARLTARPSRRELVSALSASARLGPASPAARADVEARAGGWVAAAARAGREGWDLLDVLYAEQRVRRWGRSQVPLLGGTYVAGLTPAVVARALAALRYEDRISDGFHRRFVAARAPALTPPAPDPPPGPGALAPLRRVVRRFRPAPAPEDPVDGLLARVLGERPALLAYLDAVLAGELVTRRLGPDWGRAVAADARLGRRRAVERARHACGPAALDAALRADLRPG